jgi:hypothetical protein
MTVTERTGHRYAICMLVPLLVVMAGCDIGGKPGEWEDIVIIGHEIVTLSSSQVAEAAAMRLYLEHASVGANIWSGLGDLEAQNSDYNRTNFTFYSRGNPGWEAKIDGFRERVQNETASPGDYDAMMMKFCFIDTDAVFEHYRDQMLSLESSHPDTVFVWWTMPIQTSGSAARDAFNAAVRTYCLANDKILFDIADIECHHADGSPQTDGGYEALCDEYTDDGGHLDETGRVVVAEAFWNLAFAISQR